MLFIFIQIYFTFTKKYILSNISITSAIKIIIPTNLVNVKIAVNGLTIIKIPNIHINIDVANIQPHFSVAIDFKLIAN